jgi:hypothetical protein
MELSLPALPTPCPGSGVPAGSILYLPLADRNRLFSHIDEYAAITRKRGKIADIKLFSPKEQRKIPVVEPALTTNPYAIQRNCTAAAKDL